MKLEELGWKPFFARQLTPSDGDLIPARVRRQDLDRYHLMSEFGDLVGVLPGRLRVATVTRAELPTVGDWVLVSRPANDSPVTIERTLDRFSKFSRKEAGDRTEEQVLAANIDTVFIVSGLDGNFNPNRTERYLLVARNSGATPVIVLNKADIGEEIAEKMQAIADIALEDPVFTISALNGEGLTPLREFLAPGQTVALLGSSGVGKTTIINALLGEERFQTSEVREGDDKGRHTTTYREMCVMEGGGLIIDTPGMRELQVWTDDSALSPSFSDVEELAALCRFRDCRHSSEPGCAVIEAIAAGTLDPARLGSYRKFQRELKHLEEKQGAAITRAQARAERRRFARNIRKRPTKRD